MRRMEMSGHKGWKAGAALLAALSVLFAGGTVHAAAQETVEGWLADMTLEEKTTQMFFVTPEELTGVEPVTLSGEITREAFSRCPVGGVIYFAGNIESGGQFGEMTAQMQKISLERLGIPVFLGTDEEGGRVTRLYGSGIEDIPYTEPMLEIGKRKNVQEAYETGKTLAGYLERYGINVDFAPVADIFSNPENTVIGDRSFGTDADTVSAMVPELVKGLQENGVKAVLKHFPGHGDTSEDSHDGFAFVDKTMEELRAAEWKPFVAGVEAGAEFVMVGHISLPEALGGDTPASLSREIVTGVLREEFGFDGVIITDAMDMGAITKHYTPGEAAVQAIEAGVDMILMPEDLEAACEAVLEAVHSGRLSEERIDESVKRILAVKQSLE